MKKIFVFQAVFFSIFTFFLKPMTVLADQAAWVLKADADRAVKMIDPGIEIRKYCQPCGDSSWISIDVNKVEVRKTSEKYVQVFINSHGIDLAYYYINKDGKWRNIAIILGLDVSGVSEFLDLNSSVSSENSRGKIEIIERQTSNCLDKNITTIGMLECMDKAGQMWDDELNRVYGLLKSKLKPEDQNALKASQRAWIKYRDLEFENINSIYSNFQGTMYGPMRLDHRMQFIKQRVLELQSYLDLFDSY